MACQRNDGYGHSLMACTPRAGSAVVAFVTRILEKRKPVNRFSKSPENCLRRRAPWSFHF